MAAAAPARSLACSRREGRVAGGVGGVVAFGFETQGAVSQNVVACYVADRYLLLLIVDGHFPPGRWGRENQSGVPPPRKKKQQARRSVRLTRSGVTTTNNLSLVVGWRSRAREQHPRPRRSPTTYDSPPKPPRPAAHPTKREGCVLWWKRQGGPGRGGGAAPLVAWAFLSENKTLRPPLPFHTHQSKEERTHTHTQTTPSCHVLSLSSNTHTHPYALSRTCVLFFLSFPSPPPSEKRHGRTVPPARLRGLRSAGGAQGQPRRV